MIPRQWLIWTLNLSVLMTACPSVARELQQNKSILSDIPASTWEDAMLTGNGLIGMMQYGDPLHERFVFNCHKFLYPNGAPFPVPDMKDMVEPMRDRMLAGEIGEGWALYHRELLKRQGLDLDKLTGNYAGMVWTQSYHPGYYLDMNSVDHGEITNYSRVTDYQTGQIIVQWTDQQGQWMRRNFTSRRDNVIVTQMVAPPNKSIHCALSVKPALKSPQQVTYKTRVSPDMINMRGTYPEVKGKHGGFEGVTRVVATGGATRVDGDVLVVEGARELLLLTRLDRYKDDFQQWDAKLLQIDLQAMETCYDTLLARHVAIHRELFNRVDFSLGGDAAGRALSTEKLLARELSDKEGVDLVLLEKLFYTSRYLFMASCGEQYGPRLSGMFLGQWGAAWAGDYTCDANVNLAVLGGNIAALPECMEGYFQVLERSQAQWREGAHMLYSCRGILGPVRIDGEVGVPLHVSGYHAHCTATGLGPWLLYPMWEHFQITGDKEFLRERLYPLLKQQAWFYEDFLSRRDAHGKVIFVPSNSPENAWKGVQPRTSASINSTMDVGAGKHGLRMALAAHRALGLPENEETQTWEALLKAMPPYLVNAEGALQEWSWPGHGENYNHRHSSHMYTVWPAYEINPENPDTRDLVSSVSTALDKRRARIIHAHDALMKSIARIRIKEGEKFYENLKFLLENNYFFTSLASSHDLDHKIYNYDLILTLQGLLIEMAVFTNEDVVELLPALPEAFLTGELKGVKGRSQTAINNLQWNLESRRISCQITSDIDQTITVIHRKGIKKITCNSEVKQSDIGDYAREVDLSANEQTEIILTY